ncbi:MAG: sulfotransferase, partial [Pseudomonadota bacterium]|nr:sulfotransferase [Pseudomonadota bacterium]
CNLGTLLEVLARNGPVPLGSGVPVVLALTAALLRWPFSTVEKLVVRARSPEDRTMPPPVFIVGHWRSGTTHLYNLLSRSPDFAYVDPVATALPWDFLGLARGVRPLLNRALPDDRFIDQVQVRPDSPQEDEIALANMQPLSFYHALYFPRRFRDNLDSGLFFDQCTEAQIERWKWSIRHLYRKLHLKQPGKRLLVKNPVYTARVALLNALWPGAKFIHIYRNPYVVFQSTRNFYRALFKELSLQPYDQVAVDQAILETYPRMNEALLRDIAHLDPDQVVEVRFEELEENPLSEIERIYSTLALEGLEASRKAFDDYLQSIGDYRKNRYTYAAEDNDRVRLHWKPFIERWGYEAI